MTISNDDRAVAECLSVLKAAYPQYKFLTDHAMMELWHRKLSVLDSEKRRLAIEFWINTERFPPAISDIYELCSPKSLPNKDWSEAWQIVQRAIQRFGASREIEAMKWLQSEDPMTAEAARRLGFQNCCLSQNIAQERANFRMIYQSMEEKQEADERFMRLPVGLRYGERSEGIAKLDINERTIESVSLFKAGD
nr:replicative helicase loader/inhibitor [uncultured Peptoniphilus sp.]